MGVERSVTRWYVQRQSVLEEISQLEVLLVSSGRKEAAYGTDSEPEAEIRAQLERARTQLCALGPCPKPMMG